MTAKIKRYYANGNTSQGFFSLIDGIVQGLDRLIILKGAPGTGKATLLGSFAMAVQEWGLDTEVIYSSREIEGLDGVLLPSLSFGIVNGSLPIPVEPKYPLAVEEIIYLDQHLDASLVRKKKQDIIILTDKREAAYHTAYTHFAAAKQIHLQREATYVQEMDFEKADQITDKLVGRIFTKPNGTRQPKQRHLFFGAASPAGVQNFVDHLTEELQTRIIVVGRPGSGKSTMITKIYKQAEQLGYDTELYHCSFDPLSLDMVAIPELKVAILDGTPPHQIQPSRPGDELLDMYSLCFTTDVDKEQRELLEDLNTRYKAQAQLGIDYLGEAKRYNDQLKMIYSEAMDFSQVDRILEGLLDEVKRKRKGS